MTTQNPSTLMFYKLITPYWLKENADLHFTNPLVTETEFRAPTDVRKHESMIQIHLLKKDVLKDNDDIVIKIKVGVEYPGTQQLDPMIVALWCPGEEASMGIQINNPNQYYNSQYGPFRGIQSEATRNGLLDVEPFGARKTNRGYPFSELLEFTYSPNSFKSCQAGFPWASAYGAIASGMYSAFAPYYKNLKLSQGLNLGIYRDELKEEYIIKSLEIAIYKNCMDALGHC